MLSAPLTSFIVERQNERRDRCIKTQLQERMAKRHAMSLSTKDQVVRKGLGWNSSKLSSTQEIHPLLTRAFEHKSTRWRRS